MIDRSQYKLIKNIIRKHRMRNNLSGIVGVGIVIFPLSIITSLFFLYTIIYDTTSYYVNEHFLFKLASLPARFIRYLFDFPEGGYYLHEIRVPILITGIVLAVIGIIFWHLGTFDTAKRLKKIIQIVESNDHFSQKLGEMLRDQREGDIHQCIVEIMRFGGDDAVEPLVAFMRQDLEISQFEATKEAASSLAAIQGSGAVAEMNRLMENVECTHARLNENGDDSEYVRNEVKALLNHIKLILTEI